MRAMSRLRAGQELRVRAEHEQFVGVDVHVELRAEIDLMHALQLRDQIDTALPGVQMQIGFGAAQFGQFEPARHRHGSLRARREPQMR